MNNQIQKTSLFAALAGVITLLALSKAHAQTFTWADNATGQVYLVCGSTTNYYPNNSRWSQSVQTNNGCGGVGIVISQPSNWNPAPAIHLWPGGPSLQGVDVILGSPANTVLDQQVILNNLTIKTNGALSVLGSTDISANNYFFQGDGTLLNAAFTGGNPAIFISSGGSMVKSGGAGIYSVGVELFGTNNTFEVDSGTLALPTGFGTANLDGGTFAVSNNATMLLTADSGGTPVLIGNWTGVGGGTVLFNTGSLFFSGGCSFNLPGTMFQWTGGHLSGGGPLTNAAVFNITNAVGMNNTTVYNNGTIYLADNSSVSGPNLNNDASGTFNIEGNSSVLGGSVYNYGLFVKSAGTGSSQITSIFNNRGGTVEVDAGSMALNVSGGGYISNATFVVNSGALLTLITNNYNMTIDGNLTGSGGGTILINNGTVSSIYPTTFNFPGSMFQWQGGKLGDSSINNVTNLGTLNVSGPVGIDGNFANSGTMIQSGTGGIGSGNNIYNNAGAVYDIQNDNGIGSLNYVYNSGLIKKSAGTGTSLITANLYNYGTNGTVEVDTGTIALNGGNLFTNTSFVVSNGATLDLIANQASTTEIEGTISGSGGGTVLMTNGILASSYRATLNFPGSMFQFAGGHLGNQSSLVITNIGTINISGPAGLNVYDYVANNGTMIQSGAGTIGNGVGLNNNAGGVYDIQNDNGVTLNAINNYALIKKSAGTGTSIIHAYLYNYGPNGSLEVDSGVLALNNSGGNYFTNSTLVVNNGATLDLNTVNNGTEIEGYFTGSGSGTILMTNGYVYCNSGATMNFPDSMFQWQGGIIGNSVHSTFLLTNAGTLNISGPVSVSSSYLANNGTVIQSGAGAMGSGTIKNTGIYDIHNDNGISLNNFNNYTLIKKSAGTNTSQIYSINSFYNAGGTIEVDSGTLALANSGYYFTNASSFVVSNGATLALKMTDNNTEVEGSLTGSGGGAVTMTNGTTIYCRQGVTLNFPGSMFQWQGGYIGNTATSSPLLTNAGTLNIIGPAGINGYLANNGTINQGGSGAITSGTGFQNNGAYNIQNDNGVSLGNYFNNFGTLKKMAGSGTSVINGPFNNYGAIQAASGTLLFSGGEFDQYAGTLQLNPSITFGSGQNFFLKGGMITGVGALGYTGGFSVYLNGGVLAPGNPFGTISIPGASSTTTYMNSGAVLNIVLGGPSQFSQLAVNKYLQYGGTLNVTLTNGYTPAIGTQFQIITNGSSGNSFAAVNVPHGILMTYSNAGVYLTVTGAVPAQVVSTQLSGGQFAFSFGTVTGQSYTVQQNTNLATPNWTFYTNITGNGLFYQLVLPVTNMPRSFFRVQEP